MIKLDWTLFVQVVNFFILMGVLQLILFRPLRNIMQQRRDEVEANQHQATTLDQRLEQEIAVYQEKMQQTRIKIDRDRKLLRQDLATETSRLLAEATTQAGRELQAIREQLGVEKIQALEELRENSDSLADCITEKILGRVI